MKNTEIRIRTAELSDAERLLEIYTPYVTDTAITFEYEVPSVEEFRRRIGHTLQKYPYIVATKNGQIVGYAYVGAFKERAAYDWSVETSIYVDHEIRHQGIGGALYAVMEEILRKMNVLNLNACIGYPKVEDEYLTKNSVKFHEHLGYHWVGEFHDSGYKFGRWYDMVWMEKMIGEHSNHPAPVKLFSEIREAYLENLLDR